MIEEQDLLLGFIDAPAVLAFLIHHTPNHETKALLATALALARNCKLKVPFHHLEQPFIVSLFFDQFVLVEKRLFFALPLVLPLQLQLLLVLKQQHKVLAAKHLVRMLEIGGKRGCLLRIYVQKLKNFLCHKNRALKNLIQPFLNVLRTLARIYLLVCGVVVGGDGCFEEGKLVFGEVLRGEYLF